MEGRGSKRRRVDDSGTKSGASAGADEDEWLLDEREDQDAQQASETSSFSKETRNLMEKLGMGSLKKEKEEDRVEEPIKVGTLASRNKHILTYGRSTTLHVHIHNLHNSFQNFAGQPFRRQYQKIYYPVAASLRLKWSSFFRSRHGSVCVLIRPCQNLEHSLPSMTNAASFSSPSLARNANMSRVQITSVRPISSEIIRWPPCQTLKICSSWEKNSQYVPTMHRERLFRVPR